MKKMETTQFFLRFLASGIAAVLGEVRGSGAKGFSMPAYSPNQGISNDRFQKYNHRVSMAIVAVLIFCSMLFSFSRGEMQIGIMNR